MRALPTRILPLLLVLLTGCQAIRLGAPVRPAPGDWTTTGATAARNAVTAAAIRAPLAPVWEYNAGAAFGPGGAIVVGNVLLVGTRKGELHAVNLETGKRLGMVGYKEPIEGTPVLDGNRLLVATAWGGKTLHAYDLARGDKRWSVEGGPAEAAPLLVAGTFVVAGRAGEMTGRNPTTGEVRWTLESAGVPISASPVSADGVHVIVADQEGGIRCVRARTGRVAWTAETGAPVYAAPTVVGPLLVVPTTRGTVVGLDAATGAERWRFDVPDRTVRMGPASGTAGRIVFGATDGRVRALDPRDGSPVWETALDDALAAQPLIAGDVVWIGTLGEELVAMDLADGTRLWSTTIPGRTRSAITVHDGGLILLSEPRTVTYLKPEPGGEP